MSMNQEPTLSIVIVNFNGGQLLRRCLTRLWELRRPEWEVFLVDNASRDGSATDVECEFPGIVAIRNRRNLGFATANNLALRRASGAYLLLLNPDALVEPEAIPRALSFMEEHSDVGVLGGRILLPDGTFDPAARRTAKTAATYFYKASGLSRMFARHRAFGRYYLSFLSEDQIADVDAVVGAFLLIRSTVVDQIGLLDERFFMYCEDEDWCWRARLQGWRVVYHPDVRVQHDKGSSTAQTPFRMAFHFHRSLSLYHRKHIAEHYGPMTNGLVQTAFLAGLLARWGSLVTKRAASGTRAVTGTLRDRGLQRGHC